MNNTTRTTYIYIYTQHQYITHYNSILYIPYITYGTPGSPWIWKVWGRRACARGWKIAIGMNLAEAAFFYKVTKETLYRFIQI